MQGKIYEIPLDISSGVLTQQIRALVTEDMGTNTFSFKLVKDKHVPYPLTGTIVRMMVKTPSGARIQQECTIENAVGGTISLTLKQSLLLEHGSYVAELQIYDAITQSMRLTTPTFYYHVRKSLQNSESIVATDEYTILQEALADLAGINIVVDDIRQEVEAVKLQSNEIATRQKIRVKSTVNQSIPSTVYTDVVFQKVVYGETQYFTDNKNLVAKEDGVYLIVGNARFASSQGDKRIMISTSTGVHGSESWSPPRAAGNLNLQTTMLVKLSAGNTVKLRVMQESSGAVDLQFVDDSVSLSMVRVG